jgi:serine/threonine-protein kinase
VDGDIGAAVVSARRALLLNPGSELVQRLCSGALSSVGDHAGAIRAAQAAVALDPISAEAAVNLAAILISARRYVEAEAAARRALMLGPDRAGTPATLSAALLMQGQYDEAGAAVEKESLTWSKITGRALVLAKRGQTDAARRELVALQNQFKDDASYQYAQIEAQLGDKDAAIRWLQNAQRVHDPGLTSGINVDPLLDPLRDDPRFQKMLLDLGFVKTS